MNYQTIYSKTKDQITTITINRPKKLNALNQQTIGELHHAIKSADEAIDIRVILITGAGKKAFVAGADITEFAHFNVEQGRDLSEKGQLLLFDYIAKLSTPVIAAINGFALGGGLELALAAHIRIASSNARIGLPEVSLGLIPGYGGTQRLTQLVGKGRALELILTATMIGAEKAMSYGIVNSVVSPEELLPHCHQLASQIKSNAPMAITAAIKAVNAHYESGVNGYNVEISEFANCFGTTNFKEGTSAFLEKRKAHF